MIHLIPSVAEQTIQILPREYTTSIVLLLRDDSTNNETYLELPTTIVNGNYLDITEEENNQLKIKIRDTGIGLNEDQVRRLFVPFDRLGFDIREEACCKVLAVKGLFLRHLQHSHVSQ
jgi:hypothetical protein